ncbi:MAG TPA: 1-acyl-sn-glycerol-3-phosphate acyltransferase [Methylomirabilota bacterium]|jgi:1-acyl-sn-glycerol-3-phosphate acyltransferase
MSQRVEPAGRFYGFVRLVARFWIWFLFREVAVREAGRVPPTGPVLLCVNHPNNLIDSLLVGVVLPRKIHYLANASLFRNPVLARFLLSAGAIPVHRRRDGAEGPERSAETFAASRRALLAGHVLAIYPEGTTHAEARVQRIKTGAARIALDYESARASAGADPLPPLSLIPVGLSFEARKSFRGGVLVAFGEPVQLGPHAIRARQQPAAAVQDLTDVIQRAMEAEVVHVDRMDVAEVARAVEDLYRGELVRQLRAERGLPPEAVDVFRLSRAIVEAVDHFRVHDPDRVSTLWQGIQHYRALLAEWHVRDQAVGARLRRDEPHHPVRASGAAVVGLPVFLYGAVVNAPPYLVPRWLARAFARKETDYATIRLLSSVVAFPLCWGLEIWLVGRLLGPGWAVAFAVALPLSGLLAYHYLRGLDRLRAGAAFAVLAITHRQAAARLLAERRAILIELERAKADFLATHADGDRTAPPPAPVARTPSLPLEKGARATKDHGAEPARSGPERPR